MDIRIEPILIEQKSVFIQMMELYNYDFSEYSDDDIKMNMDILVIRVLMTIGMRKEDIHSLLESMVNLQDWS